MTAFRLDAVFSLFLLSLLICTIEHTSSTPLECSSHHTKIHSSTASISGVESCADLVGMVVDNYQPVFIQDCKRWLGEDHPDLVHTYYVSSCREGENGTLLYTADICCDGSSDMRCFECSNYTDENECKELANAAPCDPGEVCQTVVSYIGEYPNTEIIRSTGCSVCNDADNKTTCADWLLNPECVYCCNEPFCNYDTPEGPPLYVGDDPCASGPCKQGATCIPDDTVHTQYTCVCTPLYTGPKCSELINDPCSVSPCRNGGICQSKDNYYFCKCPIGWGGPNCEKVYSGCPNNGDGFCENGGTCIDHQEYGWRCKCMDGWLGNYCEIPIKTCSDPLTYREGAVMVQAYHDCTKWVSKLKDQESLSKSISHCANVMRQVNGGQRFINNVHGYVDAVEMKSLAYCERGDKYSFGRITWCCPTCQLMPCKNGGWCTQADDGSYICKCRPGWYGKNCEQQQNLCLISGDPHYETFDKMLFHFQGNGTYILARSLPSLGQDFEVRGKNEKVGPVSYLYSMNITVCNHEILLFRDHLVKVDGIEVDPANYIEIGCFKILMNGQFVHVETNFDLVVEYDGQWVGFIQVPNSYSGKVEGMCGNFDGDKDTDYVIEDGTDVKDSETPGRELGIGWEVGGNNSTLPEPEVDCTSLSEDVDSPEYCGLMLDYSGVFAPCLADPMVSTDNDLINCRYDVCANSPDEDAMKKMACAALLSLSVKCAAAGYKILWREAANCSLDCPAGFVYSDTTSACPATCRLPNAPSTCHLPNTEGCTCPDGELLNNGTCINASACMCADRYGNKFQMGDTWMDDTCTVRHRCGVCTQSDGCPEDMLMTTDEPSECRDWQMCSPIQPGIGECLTVPEGTCPAGQTRITSDMIYEPPGRSCPDLISDIVNRYHPEFVEDCKRWLGRDHPDMVYDYYINYCDELDDGGLQYQAEICCDGVHDMKCFECSNFTDDGYCIEHANATTCGDNQVCQTTIQYFGDHKNTYTVKTTGCADESSCYALVDDRVDTCVDWTPEPECVYCCSTPFCNYDPPDGPPLNVGEDACITDPCRNGGTCSSNSSAPLKYTCLCPDGFTDPQCSFYINNPCLDQPCKNGGRCKNDLDEYFCICPIGWGGDHCDQPNSECPDDGFCRNGGTCVDHGVYGWRCSCTDDWIGDHCEIPALKCHDPLSHIFGARVHNEHVGCTEAAERHEDDYFSNLNNVLNHCIKYMSRYSEGQKFVNNQDGSVDKLEGRSVAFCARGDVYTFWTNTFCCPSCYSMPCQNGGWCTQADDGSYICKCRPGWYGKECHLRRHLCMISGDPHYETFDGITVHFQGPGTYILSESLPDAPEETTFRVLGTNERIGRVAYLYSVEVEVCGHRILLQRNHQVTVDGDYVDPALYLEIDCFKVLRNGGFVRLETNFDLVVEYDGEWIGFIQLPSSFAEKIQGICGNFDGDPDTDYIGRDGTNYISDKKYRDSLLGISWDIDENTDYLPEPEVDCSDILNTTINTPEYCGLLDDPTGPFGPCLSNPEVSASGALENCQYDVCINRDDPVEMKRAACSALHTLSVKCEAAGNVLLWREESNCPFSCDDGFIFKESTSACPATCRMPDAESSCHLPNTEACVCPDGQVLKDNECVDPKICGCIDSYGNQFYLNDTWISEDCQTEYICIECTTCALPVGTLSGTAYACGSLEECSTQSAGIGQCVTASSRLPTVMFDGTVLTSHNLSLSVQSGVTYSASTSLPDGAPPAYITLYKLVDNTPEGFECDSALTCTTSVKFTDTDLSAAEIYFGSHVDYGDLVEDFVIGVDVQGGAPTLRSSIISVIMVLVVHSLLYCLH